MNPKNTLALLVVAIGLFAFISFYESKHATTQQLEYAKAHVAAFDANTIDGITITNNEGTIVLQRSGDGTSWAMVSPVKDRADIGTVHQLLAGMEDLQAGETFVVDGKSADKSTMKDYGLEAPGVRLKLHGQGAPEEILFGKDTSVTGKTYMRLDGSDRVCVATNDVKTLVQKKADDFRDPRLMDFPVVGVNRLDVKSASGEIEVLKTGGDWMVNKPLKARGDVQKITQLIEQAVDTRIDSFIPESGANLAGFGLAEPRGSVTLNLEGSDRTAVLQIGQPLENDRQKVYAKLSGRESILVLPEKINDILFIKPNDVRDKHLMKVNMDIVDRIHIEAANKPELTLARKEEGWVLKTSGDAPANADMVKNFVTYLLAERIVGFVSDVATDLAKYGLDKPLMKITFSSYASENTAEAKAGEDAILTLDFGKADGDVVYARLENEPYVVAAHKNLFDAIPSDPAPWQDLGVYNYSPADITSLEVMRDGHTMELERGQGSAWVLKKAPGALNQTAVQTMLNTLAALHAARWNGSAATSLGFENPPLVIAFTTRDGKTGKLTVGTANADSMWNAQADGRLGSFVLSAPDYNALHAELLGVPDAPPAPAATTPASTAPGGVK